MSENVKKCQKMSKKAKNESFGLFNIDLTKKPLKGQNGK
jgi:hypothetical protein